MSVPLRVLGNRVLVRPDVSANAPEQTESGIYVAKSLAAAVTGEDATTSVHRGTVIAVGNPTHPLKHEAESLADKLELAAAWDLISEGLAPDAVAMLRDLVRRQPCVAIDDDVLFSHDAGQQITIDHETFIILTEDELLAVVPPDPQGVV